MSLLLLFLPSAAATQTISPSPVTIPLVTPAPTITKTYALSPDPIKFWVVPAAPLWEDFESFTSGETWAAGTTHGNWYSVYNGFGVNSIQVDGTQVLDEYPAVAGAPGITHGSLVVSVPTFGDTDFTVRMKTVAQLRTGSAPNNWETAWLLWHYTDNLHFYYIALKVTGWELGKEDPAYPGNQRFLTSNSTPSFTLTDWNTVRVVQLGNAISVYVNGSLLTSFTDTERPYLYGSIGLYNEDAHVEFDDVDVGYPLSLTLTYPLAPTPVALPLAVPAPTVALGALTRTPSPVAIPLVVPAPTISKSLSIAPTPQAIPLAVPAPAVTKALAVSPTPVAIPLALPAPTLTTPLALTPTPQTVPLIVPAPVVTVGSGPQTKSPAPIAITLVIPAPTIGVQQLLAPSPLAVPLLVPAPVVTVGSAPTALAPNPVAVPLAIPVPAVTFGAITASPTPVAIPIVIPAPTVSRSLAIAPSPVAVPLLVPVPTVTAPANQTLTPDPVTMLLVVPQPTVTSAITPVPPVVVTGGGGFPTTTYVNPFQPLIPEPRPPRQVLAPDPVTIAIGVMMASVSIDWLSKLRAEDEELLLAGVL